MWSEAMSSNISNSTYLSPDWEYLVLGIFPLLTVFGNCLVVLAICIDKTMRTPTNLLLVSLAIADLMVGLIVMPFAIYLCVFHLQWLLDDTMCRFFTVADVACSTSSIVHLMVISVDRFYAVIFHMNYRTRAHTRHIYFSIIFSWMFSIALGLPLGLGYNAITKRNNQCAIQNPNFMLFGSIFAFYLPSAIMICMYGFIFYELHKRLRAVQLQEMAATNMVTFGHVNLDQMLAQAFGDKSGARRTTLTWAMPFIKTLEDTLQAESCEFDSMSVEDIDELTHILYQIETTVTTGAYKTFHTMYDTCVENVILEEDEAEESNDITNITNDHEERINFIDSDVVDNGDKFEPQTTVSPTPEQTVVTSRPTCLQWLMSLLETIGLKRTESKRAVRKLNQLKGRAIELFTKLSSKQGIVIRKETRATKLVSTVLAVFLLCWLPFFTMNLYRGYVFWTGSEPSYQIEVVFIVFTWLGYLNSGLNPVIYSLINRKFRVAFCKLLHIKQKENYSNKLPRKLILKKPKATKRLSRE